MINNRVEEIKTMIGNAENLTRDELVAEVIRLRHALRELIVAADPSTNMSDIVVYQALAYARQVLLNIPLENASKKPVEP